MKNVRKFLYLIVTDYPFGIGEPFLETELLTIASKFEKIYLVIPESHRVDHSHQRYRLPANASLIALKTIAGKGEKAKALMKAFDPINLLERSYVNSAYGQKFGAFHLRTLIGYRAMANRFAQLLAHSLKQHGHPPEQTVLYSYWFFYATAGLAKIKESNPAYRVVTRIHGWDCYFDRNPGNYLPLRPWVTKTIDGIWAISEKGRQYTLAKLPGISSEKLHRSYLGTDALPEPKIEVSETGNCHLVSLAFIDPVKQLHRIVDALALCKNSRFHWTHIGNAPAGNTQLEQHASQKLDKLSNVSYTFKGELTKDEVFQFFANAHPDLLICTSKSEGLPVSMMEAMAHGIPVVSVDVGGISEIVKNGFNGLLLDASASAAEIAEVLINWAIREKSERIPFGIHAFQTYNEYFSAPKNYLSFCQEALQG